MNPPGDAPSWPSLPAHATTPVHGPAGIPPDGGEAAGRVLAGSLRWIAANLEWFAPRRWQEYLPPRPFGPGPLLELLGLVRVLDRSGLLPPDDPLRVRALDLAEEAAHTEGFARGTVRGDELFPYHLNLVGLLECLGRPQHELRARCEALLAAGAGGHALPYKPVLNRIELRYFIDRGGFTAPAALPGLGTLYEQSIAALGPDVLQLTESEVYALTHVLFYVTDFGHRRGLAAGGKQVAALRRTVRVLLGVHLARGSFDLLAELLLCDSALGKEGVERGGGPGPGHDDGSESLASAGWNALAAAVRPDGSVPSPVHRPDVLAGLTGDKAAAYVFGTCYHTTLAAALAAGAAPAALQEDSRAEGADVSCLPPPVPLPRAEPGEIRRWARAACAAAGTAATGELAVWRGQLCPLLVLAVQARDPDVLTDLLRAAERLGQGGALLTRSANALRTVWSR